MPQGGGAPAKGGRDSRGGKGSGARRSGGGHDVSDLNACDACGFAVGPTVDERCLCCRHPTAASITPRDAAARAGETATAGEEARADAMVAGDSSHHSMMGL